VPVRNNFDSDAEFWTALADYFAGQALMGHIACPIEPDEYTHDQMAEEAYRYADAMLLAREARRD
jgi:hypothetical protein